MPSRRWHTKSKLGCVPCKRRHLKCDETRSGCDNCARSGTVCEYVQEEYSHKGSVDTMTLAGTLAYIPYRSSQESGEYSDQAAAQASFHKKWHQKSRTGCRQCKERRIKCDETKPICEKCCRRGIGCTYPIPERPIKAILQASSKTPAIPRQLFMAQLTGRFELFAFEYFHLYTLPMFRSCQPSILWQYTIGYSAQTTRVVRDITIALGFHQQYLETTTNNGAPYDFATEVKHKSETLYARAVRSLRDTLPATSLAEAPVIALCCVLFVGLECLRGSQRNLLLHLQCAVRITTQAVYHRHMTITDEVAAIADLLQQLCINAWLYGTSHSSSGDHALILQDIDFQALSVFKGKQASLAFQINSLVVEIIYTTRNLMHPEATSQDRVALFNQLQRQRSTAVHLQSILVETHPFTANRGFLEIKTMMSQAFITGMLAQPADHQQEMHLYQRVLDILQPSITDLNAARPVSSAGSGSSAFCLDSGAIHVLETIIQAMPGTPLEDQALRLLEICPSREGLWTVHAPLQLYTNKAQRNAAEGVSQRRTLAVKEDDKLASIKDCLNIAKGMTERCQVIE